jgi:hypothetical protein
MKLEIPKSFVTIHESVESPKPWSWRVARNYSTFFCFNLFILSNPMWWKQKSWSLYRQSTSSPSLEKWYICVHVLMGDHLTMTNSRMEIRIVGCNVAIILSYGESWWLLFVFSHLSEFVCYLGLKLKSYGDPLLWDLLWWVARDISPFKNWENPFHTNKCAFHHP